MDLFIVGVDGLPMNWIRKNLKGLHLGLSVPFTDHPVGNEVIAAMAQWLIEKNKYLEDYFSYNNDDKLLPGERYLPYGLSAKGFPKDLPVVMDEAREQRLWDLMRLRHLKDPGAVLDANTREWIMKDYGIFRNSLGVYYEDLGDDAKARLPAAGKNTAAVLLEIQRDYTKSYDHFEWAQQWDPSDHLYAFNLGNSLYHLGRKEESLMWYQKTVDLKPDYAGGYFNYAVAAMDTGHYPKAGELFQKVLKLKPDYPQAKQGLDYIVSLGQFKTP